MAVINQVTTCGTVKVNTAWTQDFLAAISSEERGRGSTMSFNEREARWLNWQHSGSGGNVSINVRHWIVQVGAPADMLSPFEEIDATAFNGNVITVADAIGMDVSNLRIGDQNAQPISSGYQFNPNTGQFDFASAIGNTYLYFDTITRSANPILQGTFYYGTKPDATPLDQSDIEGGTLINYTEGIDVTAPFAGSNQRYWIARLSTDTSMIGYKVNDLDYGVLGDPDGTFYVEYTVGPYTVDETYPTSLSQTTFTN